LLVGFEGREQPTDSETSLTGRRSCAARVFNWSEKRPFIWRSGASAYQTASAGARFACPSLEQPFWDGGRVDPDEINLAIGKRLAQRRAELGLTLADVSKRCKVSLQQIHKYEIGHTPLSVPMLVQLSKCLDVPLSYFFATLEAKV
jgi:hypothetical protein